MEVAPKDGPRIALLSAMLDPYLFILASYLTIVVTLLVWLTRSAIVDDLVNIPKLPRSVKKQLAMAGISLGATWYYMIKYMFWSYSAFVDRIDLTGWELTTLPQCGLGLGCKATIAAAKLMRVSSWLRETSLFEEAWLHVVGGKLNWWWSVEICTFTVGVMALKFRTEDKKKTIPHLWAYMLLGQLVAISVAWNLFTTAVIMRKWLLVASQELTKASIEDTSALSEVSSSRDEGSSSNLSEDEDEDSQSSASSDEDGSKSSSEGESSRASPSPERKSRSLAYSYIKIYSLPLYVDLFFSLAMVSAGLISVYNTPSSLWPILVMHLCPLLSLIPIPRPSKPVSKRWRWLMSTSSIYAFIAAFSVIVRLKAHWDAWPQFHLLLPTFSSHPAQSSISADAMCLTLSVVESLYNSIKHRGPSSLLLLALLPLAGPSAVLAALYALEDKEDQILNEHLWTKLEESGEYLDLIDDVVVKTDHITTISSRKQIKEKTD